MADTIAAERQILEHLLFRLVEARLVLSTADELDLKTQLSSVEDMDKAEAIMELQIQEVSYQAAQSALAKTIQPSLTQFLR